MNFAEAVVLIVTEAEGIHGLTVGVHGGEDPGPERMHQLIAALKIVFHKLSGQDELDRDLASALFVLGSEVPLAISSLASKGKSWRREFMETEVYELIISVQSIFEDRWLGEEEPFETIH